MKKSLLRKIARNLSFTSAVFIFQACYGTPQDFGMDLLIEGQVKSKAEGKGIPGIKVSMNHGEYYEYTNNEGEFMFYAEPADTLNISFHDRDSSDNKMYHSKDTLITNVGERVFLDIELEEKINVEIH